MAVMIPEKPNRFHPGSLEDVMFEALKRLPDEYTVFHSFRITKVKGETVYESETDFVIFHRDGEFFAWKRKREPSRIAVDGGSMETVSQCITVVRLIRRLQINGN